MPDAFKGQGDFAKELCYTSSMAYWNAIADTSYQTAHELEIIKKTADDVVRQLPSPVRVIDLGAANSVKFAPYISAAIQQGKEVTYYPLDLSYDSLVQQVERFCGLFPELSDHVHALWGSFEDGDRFFHRIDGSRLFLSLGSIFFNAPEKLCDVRCTEFKRHMGPNDRLVVGQDSPCADASHSYYKSPQYNAFMAAYLSALQKHGGIQADDVTTAWSWESRMESSMHYFHLEAKRNLALGDGFPIAAGTSYRLFKSWKRGEEEIHAISGANGLAINTIGKAAESGMTQYLLFGRSASRAGLH